MHLKPLAQPAAGRLNPPGPSSCWQCICARHWLAGSRCLCKPWPARVQHPFLPFLGIGSTRCETEGAAWGCSRTIPSPKGGSKPACETVLLHREDFKIPEKMARFAVRHGMAGFVKKMGAGVQPFVEARRARVEKVCPQDVFILHARLALWPPACLPVPCNWEGRRKPCHPSLQQALELAGDSELLFSPPQLLSLSPACQRCSQGKQQAVEAACAHTRFSPRPGC